jgi:hypothetical protein
MLKIALKTLSQLVCFHAYTKPKSLSVGFATSIHGKACLACGSIKYVPIWKGWP